MKNTNKEQTEKEIVKRFRTDKQFSNLFNPPYIWRRYEQFILSEVKQAQKALISRIREEVVGEMEADAFKPSDIVYNPSPRIRNSQRATQREKLLQIEEEI